MSTILRMIIIGFVIVSITYTLFSLFNFFTLNVGLDKPAIFFAGATTTTLLSILARRMNLHEKAK